MSGKKKGRLERQHAHCAGIDVGKSKHYVAVDPDQFETPVRSFDCYTDDLEALADWLTACSIEIVAMESTGVYWIPLYEVLDRRGFEVHLVNPRATRQVSGRKSDVLDCQWLWQLMTYGLLKGAFRPNNETCVLRAYVRDRQRLTQDASRAIQHMQKALTQMNIQLDEVLSDIMGVTGQRIVRAIVAGERDGEVLARYRDRRVKADEHTIARALRGNWREEHLVSLRQALQRYDFFQTQILELDQHIRNAVPNDVTASASLDIALHQLLGVDLTAVPCIGSETELVIAAEIGPDLSRFPTCQHFCSWLTLAPDTRISGGRRLPGRPPPKINRAGQALRVAAASARNSKSFIGASHRSRLSRMDTAKAVKATAHQLARLIYAMLTRGEEYVEHGMAQLEDERRERQLHNLKRQARALGLELQAA
jgi:transposase